MKRRDIDYNGWNEDSYPTRGDREDEYWESYEDEDDEYLVGYDSVPSNIDLAEFEEAGGFQKTSRKVHSLESYYNKKAREKKKQQQKIRAEIKEREKQRQKYYHYEDSEE